MKLGCVILNYNDSENTVKCMQNIKNYQIIDEIILVDNCSTDNSFMKLKKYSDDKVSVLKAEKNGGYGYGNNLGVNYAFNKLNCKYVIIMNPDVVIEEKTVKKMIKVIGENKDIGIIAPLQVDRNGKASILGWSIPTINQYVCSPLYLFSKIGKKYYRKVNRRMEEITEIDCVLGALLMVDAQKFVNCGGYDEDIFLFCEEVVLAIRMKNCGYKTLVLTDEKYWHFHSLSINKSIPKVVEKKKLLFSSRETILKKYLQIDSFRLKLYQSFCRVGLVEEYIKNFIKSRLG